MFASDEPKAKQGTTPTYEIWALPGPVALSLGAPGRLDVPPWWMLPDGLRGLAVVVKIGSGQPQWVVTNAGTTRELLDALDVSLAPTDVVQPSGRKELTHGMSVQVVRIRKEQVTIAEEIPFETVTRDSGSLAAGQAKVVQEGTPGQAVRTYLITYRNEQESRREIVSEVVLRDPVSRIVEQGTAYSAPPLSGGASAAVSAAYSVLGVPYSFGGTGPSSGFDCSGLTMWAWAYGGVSLPHSASSQYSSTRRVSSSELKPGDLLFFYSGASHVAIYVGGNQMIMALKTGTNVQLATISSYWWGEFVGAGRPG